MVATKVDKMKTNELEKSLSSLTKAFNLQEHELLPFSAVTGQGRKEIWRAIRATMLDEDEDEEGDEGDDVDQERE
jgi:GTP-binding protein